MDKVWVARKAVLSLVAAGFILWGTPVFAVPIILIDENFNDVTGLVTAGAVRTVANILATTPTQLPAGTLHTSIGSSPNVRRTDNTINASTGSAGFDSFFSPTGSANRFLVLGDDSGVIGGAPAGATNANVTAVQFPFEIQGAPALVEVKFNYAFDGVDTSTALQDSFAVKIRNGITEITLMHLVSPSNFDSGTYQDSILFNPGVYRLVFELTEANGSSTNTAAGVDDILLSAYPVSVPEPASLLLLGSALAGLGMWRLQRKRT